MWISSFFVCDVFRQIWNGLTLPVDISALLFLRLHCFLSGVGVLSTDRMTWRPQYHSSKYRHVFGKPASKENCYDGVPITQSVHDNHLCAVNPRFIAVITECAGGGAFLVLSINHTGKVNPHHPKVSGHRGNVLDIKWNPFNDFRIASCSEDTTVKVWDIPDIEALRIITVPWKELQGHSRRVSLIEWHPTANNIIFSAGYDYQVLVWKLDVPEQVIKNPVRCISVHSDVVLSMSFNTDGSRLATSCKDKKIRVIDPRSGVLLQESDSKTHKASKVLFLGNLHMLLSTGNSLYNHRQIALWDLKDLSQSSYSEDLDGSSGVLFPFYDPDTHMLYIAGKGDGNIRYYEISSEKPYVHYLTEYRSPVPQKGIGVMPKRGLDVCSCEIFRFYKLVTAKSLIEPVSMIVPRRSDSYQEDIYPLTAANRAALTADEWISGRDKGPEMVSLRPGSELDSSAEHSHDPDCLDGPRASPDEDRSSTSHISNGELDSAPETEQEIRQLFYKQQEEIRRLKEQLLQKDTQIKQLELEIRNQRNSRDTL
ncbi:coronin-2B isoform X2 [Carassius gibelio]|uniref:coronin-2B isoform X2 n=1 Tax=Carassius gibelio TaxID=101364 RepID=UPI00227788CE|nr:coronin-2B isoform X2 [Carassius gibelio]